jgi:8-oxo-dGTP pyrophosphatase MutT (NUDIX family)
MKVREFLAVRFFLFSILCILLSISVCSTSLSGKSASVMNPSTTLSAEELVEIVDENNNPVEPRFRKDMRKYKLPHRATYAFVRNKCNYLYVQKRSALKDYCPQYFDANPGGVVAAGESYEVTNQRELEEEMGIPLDTPQKHLFTFYFEDERIKCFGDAWEVEYDGPLKLQVEEVESIHLMSMEEILSRADAGEKFTPDSIFACRMYVDKYGCPQPTGPKTEPTIKQ